MPLEQASITLVSNWKKQCEANSVKHFEIAQHLKLKYKIFGMLQLLIPVGFTLATTIMGQENDGGIAMVASIGFSCTAITTVVLNFLNFKVLSTKHELASNSYHTIVNDIDSIMTQHAYPPEILIVKIKNELRNLEAYSPSIDGC